MLREISRFESRAFTVNKQKTTTIKEPRPERPSVKEPPSEQEPPVDEPPPSPEPKRPPVGDPPQKKSSHKLDTSPLTA